MTPAVFIEAGSYSTWKIKIQPCIFNKYVDAIEIKQIEDQTDGIQLTFKLCIIFIKK